MVNAVSKENPIIKDVKDTKNWITKSKCVKTSILFMLGMFSFSRMSPSLYSKIFTILIETLVIPSSIIFTPLAISIIYKYLSNNNLPVSLRLIGLYCIYKISYNHPKWFRQHLKKFYGSNTDFQGNLKIESNSVYMMAPHGPTVFPMARFSAYIWRKTKGKLCGNIVCNKSIKYLPILGAMVNDAGSYVDADMKSIIRANHTNPLLIYPGGEAEVIFNSVYNSPHTIIYKYGSNLLKFIKERNMNIIPLLIQHETRSYWQPQSIVRFFEFVNLFVKVGVPIPPIFLNVSNSPRMLLGDAINEDNPVSKIIKFFEENK